MAKKQAAEKVVEDPRSGIKVRYVRGAKKKSAVVGTLTVDVEVDGRRVAAVAAEVSRTLARASRQFAHLADVLERASARPEPPRAKAEPLVLDKDAFRKATGG